VREISKVWENQFPNDVDVFLGASASEDCLKHVAGDCAILHIATHGFFLSGKCPAGEALREHPLLQSGIFMAGANRINENPESFDLDDGILTAYEIASLDLHGAQLVVLSACETGLGEVVNGEGVYGLRRAFQIAGAQTVVSTLWPVSDALTSEMTSALYIEPNLPVAERIRNMQLRQIQNLRKNGLSDHPYSWAGFVAFGNL
jgi:CHAT domain-containing protein